NSGTETTAVPFGGGPLMLSPFTGFDIPPEIGVAANNGPATGLAFAVLSNVVGTHLYTINLSTGALADVGQIGGTIGRGVQGFALAADYPDVPGLPAVGLDAAGVNLVRFGTATPGTATGQVAVGGLAAGEVLVGIDYRPATGQLYGLGVNATM